MQTSKQFNVGNLDADTVKRLIGRSEMAGRPKKQAEDVLAVYEAACKATVDLWELMPDTYRSRGPEDEEANNFTWWSAVQDMRNGVYAVKDLADLLCQRGRIERPAPLPECLMSMDGADEGPELSPVELEL